MKQEEFENKVFVLKDRLFRFARKILKDSMEAEDVVQEIMTGFWHRRFELPNLQNIEAYAMQSVKNLSLDKIKHHKVRQDRAGDLLNQTETVYHDDSGEKKEITDLIKKTIALLPEKQRMVIHLRDIEDYSFEEMSKVLDMDETALRVNLSRARKKVKEEIQKILNYGI
ncbi:MAG: RNA polymerase sigma factor [Bacteroidales bacterium]